MDLIFLKEQGWETQIHQHCRYSGKVLGICGGYQMLGKHVLDPNNIESTLAEITGLNLLPLSTTLTDSKTLTQVSGTLNIGEKACSVRGYEIHCGVTTIEDELTSLITFENHPDNELCDGTISQDGQIMGTYLHGLFDSVEATKLILDWVKPESIIDDLIDLDKHREIQLDRLADVSREHLAIDKIADIIKQPI